MKIWINRAGQNLGTFTLEEVQHRLDQGQFVATDLAWQEGMETWKPLSEFPGLTVPPAKPEAPPLVPAAVTPGTELATMPGTELAPAWERLSELGFGKALFTTFRQVLFEPGPTFARLPLNGKLGRPTGFFVAAVGGVIALQLLVSLGFQLALIPLGGAFSHLEEEQRIGPGMWAILLPVMAAVGLALLVGVNFIMAGIYHLLLTLLGGATKGYEGTYKVICYSHAAEIISVVPCVGPIAAIVWYLIASIIGLQKVHQTEGWKAAVAMLVPYIVCFGTLAALTIYFVAQAQKELR
jgi:hypothetical protein